MEFFIQNVFQTNGSENKMMQNFRPNKEMIWISFWRLYVLTSAKKKNSKRWMVLENNYTNRDKLLPDNSDTDTLNTRRCFTSMKLLGKFFVQIEILWSVMQSVHYNQENNICFSCTRLSLRQMMTSQLKFFRKINPIIPLVSISQQNFSF